MRRLIRRQTRIEVEYYLLYEADQRMISTTYRLVGKTK